MKKEKFIAMLLLTAVVLSLSLPNAMVYGDVTTYGGCVDGGNHWYNREEYYVTQDDGYFGHYTDWYEVVICMKENCSYRQILSHISGGIEEHSFYRYSDTHTPGLHHTTFKCSVCGYKDTVSYSCPGNPCLIFDSIVNELYE